MLARLRAQTLLRLHQVAVGSPCVRGAARHLLVAEVRRSRSAVLCGEVELLRDLVVQRGGRLQSLAQFQTLTSR